MEDHHKRFKELRDHLHASRTALHSALISDSVRRANQMGRYHSSWNDPGQTIYLVASHRKGEQENCSKDGLAGSSPEQEERSLHQEWSSAIQAAHPPPDGLRVPHLEVRCPHTCQEAEGATVQVSSPFYGCPLVP